MLLTCSLPILATEGSRVLEKKVNETQVSKTVFSHLNAWIISVKIMIINCNRQMLPPMFSFRWGSCPGGYSQKNWVEVSDPFRKTLTIFMTKICNFPYPIYNLFKSHSQFVTKMAENPTLWATHTYIPHIREYPLPPGYQAKQIYVFLHISKTFTVKT